MGGPVHGSGGGRQKVMWQRRSERHSLDEEGLWDTWWILEGVRKGVSGIEELLAQPAEGEEAGADLAKRVL